MSAAEFGDSAAAERFGRRRESIIEEYEKRLEAGHSRILATDVGRHGALEQAANVHADVQRTLRDGVVYFDETTLALTSEIGNTRASGRVHPIESLRAGDAMFDIMLDEARTCIGDGPAAARLMAAASASLHHSIMTRIREGATAYASFLLSRIHEAHLGERRRMVRELHDRVGSGVAAAARNLELLRMYLADDPQRAETKLDVAETALRDASDGIRRLISDLRLHTEVETMESALRRSVELLTAGETEIRLSVSGDEGWANPDVLDEIFLMVREALRNAIMHAEARTVAARIDIAPHEVHAVVQDDGIGFTSEVSPAGHMGLTGMRDRVALLGGIIAITSAPGQGTSIEVHVPLMGATGGSSD